MREIKFKLTIHTPWTKIVSAESCKKNDLLSDEDFFAHVSADMSDFRTYKCGKYYELKMNNLQEFILHFYNDVDENIVREEISILIYLITIFTGSNLKIDNKFIIDENIVYNFYTLPTEDNLDILLYRDVKFYEFGMENLHDYFSNILTYVNSLNRKIILTLGSNYFNCIFYKDFIDNLSFKFRIIVTNLESLISLINKDKYSNIRIDNKNFLKNLKQKNYDIKKEIEKSIMEKSVSLKEKIKDVFSICENDFGLKFKNENLDNYCEKVANTRNFISHIFDKEKEYLNIEEQQEFISVMKEIYRMLFLKYINIDSNLIKERFLRFTPTLINFKSLFIIK